MLSLWVRPAPALDVTGNWSFAGAPLSQIMNASFTQTGSSPTMCYPGWGTVVTGTVQRRGGAQVLLKAKSNQRSALKVSGVATNLSPPLVGDVTVQLTARDAAPARCWSTTFSAPQTNEPGKFSAKLP